ncbi:MAG: hypothetical protein JWQ36_1296 [Enterovirga sp.]|nr:hypothetical protein [Enterovirga sp.]
MTGGSQSRLFDCDPHKREWLIAERGLDLLSLLPIFDDGARLDFEDRRRDYGEVRRVTVGEVRGRVFTLVYTLRGEVTWLITAWPSSRRERTFYAERALR